MIFNFSRFQLSSLIIIFFATSTTNAQSGFKEGYIITSSFDTIAGFINAKDKRIYTSCAFRLSEKSSTQQYNPDQLVGFRILEGKYFVSKTVPIDGEDKFVFLEYLVKGKADIYYLRNTNDHYFIETENTELLELTEKTTMVKNDMGTFAMPKRHKLKLKAILGDSKEIETQIETVGLNHKSLTKLAVNYHYDVCKTEDCIVFERKETKLYWSFATFIGFSNYKIDLGTELKSNPGNSLYFGGRVEMGNILPWSEHIGLGIDLSFQSFNTKSFDIEYGGAIRFTLDGEDYLYVNNIFNNELKDKLFADLEMIVMQLPVSFYYYLGNGKIKPYFKVGVMNEIVLKQNTNFLYDRFSDQFGQTVPTYHFGALVGIGSKIFIKKGKAIILEIDYNKTANTNTNELLKLQKSVFSLKIGYQFM